MSDFLTRITRLTRGETTAVKPRLPGHFAAVADTSPAEPAEAAIEAQVRQPAAVPPKPSHQLPDKLTAGPQDQARKHGVDETAVKATRARTKSLRRRVPPAASGNGINHASPVPASSRPPIEDSPARQPATIVKERTAVTAGSPVNGSTRRGRHSPGRERTAGLVNGTVTTGHTREPATDRQLLIRTQPEIPPEPVFPDLLQPGDAGATAGSEAGVHINIGRIEIRASTTAPRPRIAKPQPQGSLSLQDYLERGRTGGNRP